MAKNKFIYEGGAGNSLGTMKVDRIGGPYSREDEKLKIRFLIFHDEGKDYYSSNEYRLYSYVRRNLKMGGKLDEILQDLSRRLKQAHAKYVRLGLARPHRFDDDKDEDPRYKCYIQILGIYTFPDYLRD